MKIKEKFLASCQWCGTSQSIWVYPQDWDDWTHGAMIQNAMPYLSPDEREMLISRTCSACWEGMFA